MDQKEIRQCIDRVYNLYAIASDSMLRNSEVYVFTSWTVFFDEFENEICISRYVIDFPFTSMTWGYAVNDILTKSDDDICMMFYKDMIEAIDYRDRLIARFSKK